MYVKYVRRREMMNRGRKLIKISISLSPTNEMKRQADFCQVEKESDFLTSDIDWIPIFYLDEMTIGLKLVSIFILQSNNAGKQGSRSSGNQTSLISTER